MTLLHSVCGFCADADAAFAFGAYQRPTVAPAADVVKYYRYHHQRPPADQGEDFVVTVIRAQGQDVHDGSALHLINRQRSVSAHHTGNVTSVLI